MKISLKIALQGLAIIGLVVIFAERKGLFLDKQRVAFKEAVLQSEIYA